MKTHCDFCVHTQKHVLMLTIIICISGNGVIRDFTQTIFNRFNRFTFCSYISCVIGIMSQSIVTGIGYRKYRARGTADGTIAEAYNRSREPHANVTHDVNVQTHIKLTVSFGKEYAESTFLKLKQIWLMISKELVYKKCVT